MNYYYKVFVGIFSLILAQYSSNSSVVGRQTSGLRVGFYDSTCPGAEDVVRQIVTMQYKMDPTIAAGLLRLHFHDCFVHGCDASILLDVTPTGEPVEKASLANGLTLRGADVIDQAKAVLESRCPATVSCADILTFAAREAVVLSGLRSYPVPSGRRDGTVSRAADVISNVPLPYSTMEQLAALFSEKNLSHTEMVILSGAHSIGGAHCLSFSNRLYNFTPEEPQDTRLDYTLASQLKKTCGPPLPNDDSVLGPKVDFDQNSSLTLDTSYYFGLQTGRGLLASDQEMMEDRRASTMIGRMVDNPARWQRKFRKAMAKLGTTGVLVGDEGQVRTSCRFVNLEEFNTVVKLPVGGIL
ncbi:peroxidase 5-like [Typha latifolia]|uniref:peroxidase 5-like n=1 Tax=Typha latifolia TaxID=4733 RepID=UPI003C3004F1